MTQPTTTALAQTAQDPLKWLAVASHDPAAITQRMQYAAEHFNLVSPATVCATVPDGCDVVLSVVTIAPAATYPQQGKVALGKVALDRIAAAAGVVWDPILSGRIDDGRDPHYCSFRAVGRVRDLDGTVREIFGTKELDLRDRSAEVARIEADAREGKDWRATLRQMRAFILAHAETKARLRAIRSLGIRTSYEKAEASKPFVIAKLMFTGASSDPVLRREFARMNAAAMLGGARALYGSTPPQLGRGNVVPLGTPAPPVGSVVDHDEDGVIDTTATPVDAPQTQAAPPPPEAAAPPPPPPPAPPATPSPARGAGGPVYRFGKLKGSPLSHGSDADLSWYAGALEKGVNDPEKAQYRAAGERQLAEVRAEQQRRATARQAPPPTPQDVHGEDDIPYDR